MRAEPTRLFGHSGPRPTFCKEHAGRRLSLPVSQALDREASQGWQAAKRFKSVKGCSPLARTGQALSKSLAAGAVDRRYLLGPRGKGTIVAASWARCQLAHDHRPSWQENDSDRKTRGRARTLGAPAYLRHHASRHPPRTGRAGVPPGPRCAQRHRLR
jgi:hypothetical protein